MPPHDKSQPPKGQITLPNSALEQKIRDFQRDVAAYLYPIDPSKVCKSRVHVYLIMGVPQWAKHRAVYQTYMRECSGVLSLLSCTVADVRISRRAHIHWCGSAEG